MINKLSILFSFFFFNILSVSFAAGLTNFTLVNAQTNLDYYILSTNDTVVLANTPLITIRADVNAPVTKIEFYLDGIFIRSEGVAPYAINGDAGGVYNAWTGYTKNVIHELKAYAFNGATISDSLVINLIFVDSQGFCRSTRCW